MDKKIPCKSVQELLALQYYGELGPEEAGVVTEHITSCERCRAEYEGLSVALDSVPVYAPAEGEVHRAVNRVHKRLSGRHRTRVRRFAPAFGLAAVIALVVVALFSHWSPVEMKHKQAPQVVVAQTDWDTLNNLDVLPDIDVIEDMDTIDQIENM